MGDLERKVTVVVDTTCDLDAQTAEEYGIVRQDAHIIFPNNEQYLETQLSIDDFYGKMKRLGIPKTAAPNLGEFLQTYTSILNEGGDCLVFTVTSLHSSIYANACEAAKQVLEKQDAVPEGQRGNIVVIDSKTTTGPFGLLAMRTALYAKTHSLNETVEYAESLVPRTRGYATVTKFDNIKKSGRLPRIAGILAPLAELLQIRPLLTIKDGDIILLTRPRTDAGLATQIKNKIAEDINYFRENDGVSCVDLFYMHGNNPKTLEAIKPGTLEALAEAGINCGIIHEGRIGAGIGAHGGPTFAGVGILYNP